VSAKPAEHKKDSDHADHQSPPEDLLFSALSGGGVHGRDDAPSAWRGQRKPFFLKYLDYLKKFGFIVAVRLIAISGVLILLLMGGLRMLSSHQGQDAVVVPLEMGISIPVEILRDGEVPAIQQVVVNP
jgi:hypothetical protein